MSVPRNAVTRGYQESAIAKTIVLCYGLFSSKKKEDMMVERYVFVRPTEADEFMRGICALGVETDTGFRIDTPGGNIMLHIRGVDEAIGRVPKVSGYVWMTDRLA